MERLPATADAAEREWDASGGNAGINNLKQFQRTITRYLSTGACGRPVTLDCYKLFTEQNQGTICPVARI